MNHFEISGVIERYVSFKKKGNLRNSRAMMETDDIDSIPISFRDALPIRGERIHAVGQLRGLIHGGVCLEVQSWEYAQPINEGEKNDEPLHD